MNRERRTRPRSRVVATFMAILAVLVIGYMIQLSEMAKLGVIDAEIARAEKQATSGDAPRAKAALASIVEGRGVCWIRASDEQARRDRARVALARIYDRERETARAAKLLGEVRTEPAKAEAERLLGRFEARNRLAEADTLATGGKWADAEAIYVRDLGFDRESLAHRMRYYRLLVRQGRTAEARSVYLDGVFAVEKPQDVLLSTWVMDSDEPKVSEWESDIATAASLAPEDRRVRLAQAYLASSAGQFDTAYRHIADAFAANGTSGGGANVAISRMPQRQAALRLGLDSPDHFQGGMLLAFAETEPSPLELPEQDAYLALARIGRVLGLVDFERKWLEKLLEVSPADRSALSRLSELAKAAGQREEAARIDRRKAEAETIRIEYTRLARRAADPTPAEAAKLAEMARQLGLPLDAWAWGRIAEKRPIDPDDAPRPVMVALNGHLPDEFRDAIRSDSATGSGGSLPAPTVADHGLRFADIAGESGLGRFVHINGGESAQLTPPLSSSGGVAVFDFDGDGHLDVFAVQSGTFPPDPGKPHDGDKLFRNRGDGTFDDVTAKAGIDRFPRGFGNGVAVGDIDNDRHPDLFVTRWRSYALYRNRGDGTFEDATGRYGLAGNRDWPTSAAFADLDNDGDLDLYVCHYLEWIEGKTYACIDPAKPNTYDCRPRDFPALQDRLYRNDGDRFTDVSEPAGIAAIDQDGRGLGVVAVDVNDDGLVDLFVANDTTANYLLINKGDMRFEDEALISGVAANAQGGFQAGMGVAAADLTGDGLIDLAVTNFFNESTTIFVNLGGGLFADRSAALGVAAPSRFLLGFGIVLTDFDLDGLTDYMTANGHVTDGRPAIPWRMPLQVLRGTQAISNASAAGGSGEIRFVNDSPRAGEPFSRSLLARGLATGDLDGDGLTDVVAQSQNDPLLHLKNESLTGVAPERRPHWIGLDLVGTKSNRDAVGAVVTVKFREESGATSERRYWRTGGGSFQSASSGRMIIGLGFDRGGKPREAIESLSIRWPSGATSVIEGPDLDQVREIREKP